MGDIERLKYFGSVLYNNGCFKDMMKHMMKRGWMKWRETSDKRILIRLKGIFLIDSGETCYDV